MSRAILQSVTSSDVAIPPLGLAGTLNVPKAALGLVVFAHGSGSSRHSPRNTAVAQALNSRGFATLLFDLLTPPEEADRANVFDISLLAERLVDAVRWLDGQGGLIAELPIGLFGASTGAAAALVAAARLPARVGAVVFARRTSGSYRRCASDGPNTDPPHRRRRRLWCYRAERGGSRPVAGTESDRDRRRSNTPLSGGRCNGCRDRACRAVV
jgi:pimeloyl-ACP methyl ester carboxylesterase